MAEMFSCKKTSLNGLPAAEIVGVAAKTVADTIAKTPQVIVTAANREQAEKITEATRLATVAKQKAAEARVLLGQGRKQAAVTAAREAVDAATMSTANATAAAAARTMGENAQLVLNGGEMRSEGLMKDGIKNGITAASLNGVLMAQVPEDARGVLVSAGVPIAGDRWEDQAKKTLRIAYDVPTTDSPNVLNWNRNPAGMQMMGRDYATARQVAAVRAGAQPGINGLGGLGSQQWVPAGPSENPNFDPTRLRQPPSSPNYAATGATRPTAFLGSVQALATAYSAPAAMPVSTPYGVDQGIVSQQTSPYRRWDEAARLVNPLGGPRGGVAARAASVGTNIFPESLTPPPGLGSLTSWANEQGTRIDPAVLTDTAVARVQASIPYALRGVQLAGLGGNGLGFGASADPFSALLQQVAGGGATAPSGPAAGAAASSDPVADVKKTLDTINAAASAFKSISDAYDQVERGVCDTFGWSPNPDLVCTRDARRAWYAAAYKQRFGVDAPPVIIDAMADQKWRHKASMQALINELPPPLPPAGAGFNFGSGDGILSAGFSGPLGIAAVAAIGYALYKATTGGSIYGG